MVYVLATLKLANLALSFVLELCLLVALGYWGFETGTSPFAKVALGIGAPLLAAIIWGVFMAPRASVPLPEPWHLVLAVVLFGAAAAALYVAGHPTLAWVLALVFVINRILIYVWQQ